MTPRFQLVARSHPRKNDLSLVTFLQPDRTWGAKETAKRYQSTTEGWRAAEGLDVGADAVNLVPVSK